MGDRYYWIRLNADFFDRGAIDFLMSQENGSDYVVLYQMLCLQTINNGGELATRVGEMIIPYDVKKIVRDTKYFTVDTVTVALELFKKLGLIYADDGCVLRIVEHDAIVGSETKSAVRMRKSRENRLALSQCDSDEENSGVTESATELSQCDADVTHTDATDSVTESATDVSQCDADVTHSAVTSAENSDDRDRDRDRDRYINNKKKNSACARGETEPEPGATVPLVDGSPLEDLRGPIRNNAIAEELVTKYLPYPFDPNKADRIGGLIDQYGEDRVRDAFDKAVDGSKGAISINYIKSILEGAGNDRDTGQANRTSAARQDSGGVGANQRARPLYGHYI